MRHKLFIFLLASIGTLFLSACAIHPKKPQPLVYGHWQLKNKSFVEKSKSPNYYIEVNYPAVESGPETAATQALNQMIHDYIANRIKTFKDKLPAHETSFDDYPIEMRNNELRISYSAHLLRPKQHTIVSLRFKADTVWMGEMRSTPRFAVINYDLTTGESLTLASLFKPNTNYLEPLASACRKQLIAQVAEDMNWSPWDPHASGPYAENFTIWNLSQKGFLITFQEYQVSPYSGQAETLLIPYSSLRSILAENSPLTTLAYRSYAG